MPQLPPPDPHESLGMVPDGAAPMPAPAAVFVMGPPKPETERAANALLAVRPGALIVVAEE